MAQTYVTTVVPNWNGATYLAEALESLQRQTTKHQLVVVDNGSTDGSAELVRSKFPDVTLIEESKNHGFAGGVNIGIRHALKAGATDIALFNNDAVAEPSWLAELLEATKHADIAASRIMQYDDRSLADTTGDFMSIWGIPYPRDRDTKPPHYSGYPEIFSACGGAVLYKREVFDKINLFDEAFFAYYEDVDLSFRARLAGFKIVLAPKSVLYHRIGGTSAKLGHFARYHSLKNMWYTYLKNMPTSLFWALLPRMLFVQTLLFASAIRNGAIGPALKSYGTLLLHTPSVFRQRHAIQKQRVVSAPDIRALLTDHWPLKSRVVARILGQKKVEPRP